MGTSNLYRIADHIFKINTLFDYFAKFAKDYLISEGKEDFEITISQEDIEVERKFDDEVNPGHNASDPYLESIAVFRKLMDCIMPLGYYLIHGSAVAVDNKVYLFTALSGTGKSTHTFNWLKVFGKRAFIINGDKPIIHIEGDKCYLFGTPWAGKEMLQKNMKLPLKAIVHLTRDKKNHIEPISFEEMYPTLFTQMHKNRTDKSNVEGVLSFMDGLSKTVSFYRLGCNMEQESAIVAYKGMNKNLQFEDILLFDGQLIYTAKGVSMLPLIKQHHDVVTIESRPGQYKVRDAVLFKRDNGQYVLHRIIKKHGDKYDIVGDHQYIIEKNIREDQIMGVLTSVDKGKKTIKETDFKYKYYVHLWMFYYPIRCMILWGKAKAKGFLRRIFKRKK